MNFFFHVVHNEIVAFSQGAYLTLLALYLLYSLMTFQHCVLEHYHASIEVNQKNLKLKAQQAMNAATTQFRTIFILSLLMGALTYLVPGYWIIPVFFITVLYVGLSEVPKSLQGYSKRDSVSTSWLQEHFENALRMRSNGLN